MLFIFKKRPKNRWHKVFSTSCRRYATPANIKTFSSRKFANYKPSHEHFAAIPSHQS